MDGIGLDQFKRAMRALPAQVAVISSQTGETRIAMTATAVTSLSAEPPQLLVCVHQMARPASIIRDAQAFAVNLVTADQVEVASQCAVPGLEPEQRFDKGSWSKGGVMHQPFLDGALVNLDCRLVSQAEQGTHFIFVGLIEDVRFSEGDPLLYHDASYRRIGDRVDALHLEWDNRGLAF